MATQVQISADYSPEAERLLFALVDHSALSGNQLAAVVADLGRAAPALLDQWVIACSGGHLYTDGEVPSDSEDLRPEFFSDRAKADREHRALAERTEIPGVSGWAASVVRLRDLPTLARIPAAAVAEQATAEAITPNYVPPAEVAYLEFAVALPGGVLYRDDDSSDNGRREDFGPDGTVFTVYSHDWDAAQAAAEVRENLAQQGIDYPVTVVVRQVVRVTSDWQNTAA